MHLKWWPLDWPMTKHTKVQVADIWPLSTNCFDWISFTVCVCEMWFCQPIVSEEQSIHC